MLMKLFTRMLLNLIEYLSDLEKKEVAFIEWLTSTGEADEETRCLKLKWESNEQRFGIVEINNNIRIVFHF